MCVLFVENVSAFPNKVVLSDTGLLVKAGTFTAKAPHMQSMLVNSEQFVSINDFKRWKRLYASAGLSVALLNAYFLSFVEHEVPQRS